MSKIRLNITHKYSVGITVYEATGMSSKYKKAMLYIDYYKQNKT